MTAEERAKDFLSHWHVLESWETHAVTEALAAEFRAHEAAVRREQIEIDANIADDSDLQVEGRGYYDQLGDSGETAANIRKAILSQLTQGNQKS